MEILTSSQLNIIDYARECANPDEKFYKMKHNHGCVCAIGNNIISVGTNNPRSFSRDKIINGASCHAEMDAIRRALSLSGIGKKLKEREYVL